MIKPFFLILTIFLYACQDVAIWMGGKKVKPIKTKMVVRSGSESSGSWVVLCPGASNELTIASVYPILFNFFFSDMEVTKCILINLQMTTNCVDQSIHSQTGNLKFLSPVLSPQEKERR